MSKHCPICEFRYYAVDECDEVCSRHQGWIVTTCHACRHTCFSDAPGVCPNCTMGRKSKGFGKDRRASLRSGGMEGWG